MPPAVSRLPGEQRSVAPIELFFDLVYVLAIGQLTHHLVAHVDSRTGAETAVLALAVIYAWYMVAWGANWLDPDRLPVRALLIGLMFASLLMSVGIPDAFTDRPWLFVVGYLVIQMARAAFLMIALSGRKLSQHFANDLVWELAAGGFWVAGALAHDDARLALWGVAVVVTYAGVWTLHWLPGRGRAIDLEHTDIASGHLLERFRLFFIIALGETVLTTGNAFTEEPFEIQRLATMAVSFAGTVALWWCYFHRAEQIGEDVADRNEDGGAVGWLGTWTVTLLVLALITIAAGDELAVAHPGHAPSLGFSLLVFGGPALFLLAQTLFIHKAAGTIPRSRVLGIAALAVAAVATSPLALTACIAASTAVLIAVAVSDSRTVYRRT